MRSPRPFAARHLLALIAALGVASTGAKAHAQADPFALPDNVTAQTAAAAAESGPLLVEIVVDGQTRRRMVHIDGRGDLLTIDAEDAAAAGLPVAQGSTGPVRMAALKLYRWSFDTLRQQLKVELFRTSDGVNFRDLAARQHVASETNPLTAVRVDYDLTASLRPHGSSAGGLFDAYLVRGNLSLGSGARVLSNAPTGTHAAVRLDSDIQYLWEAKGLVATGGDFVSAGSQSQRPVRLGGVQIATDFQLRPDLVTMPLPAFSGTVAVPTTIDLVGANQRTSLGEVEPGEFTVRNIPVAPGRGEVSAILRDSLGREVIETSRFYVSRDLLAPSRTAFAVNAGFVRRRYGIVSNDYGPLAATAYVRRGVSRVLTLEGSGEWTAGVLNLGARADFTILNLAKATAEVRFSRDADAGTGTLLNFGIESIGPRFGVTAGATLPSATYRDVATRLGDPLPPRQLFASGFYRIGANTQLQLNYVRQESRADPRFRRLADRSDTVGLGVQTPLSTRIRLYGAADYRRINGVGSGAVSAGLSINLGGPRHAGASVRHSGGHTSAGAVYTRDDVEDGDIGYRLAANLDDGEQSAIASVAWRAQALRLEGEVEEVGGRFAGRLNARGTLLMAGGKFYARNTTTTGYALVRAGTVEGVPITLENRLVGHTDAHGTLLVQDIPALTTVKVDVDPDKLPADALVKATTHMIRVPKRTVALVEIDAVRFRPVMRALVDARGTPLASGLPVRMLPSDSMTLTGFDGEVELNAGANEKRLIVGHPGAACVVDLAGVDLAKDDRQPLVCTPRIIADESATPAKRTAKAERGPRRVARRD
jgi:outer membrane usher protein